MTWLQNLPWLYVIVFCLTLGLAPFAQPHVWEKLQMLLRGDLVRPLDWFDFLMHLTPWVLLVLKAVQSLSGR